MLLAALMIVPLSWFVESGRNGLVLGVGRDDFGGAKFADRLAVVNGLTGGNFDGTVPARALLVVGNEFVSGGGTKSGNPS